MNQLVEMLREFLISKLPRKFVKHYVRPITIRGNQVPYNPKVFFESCYISNADKDFSDRITISPNQTDLFSHYHYNCVENAIIEYFSRKKAPQSIGLLDIGSGAGHWIDFYREIYPVDRIVGIDVASPVIAALKHKYSAIDNIRIVEANVSDTRFDLREKFDIINAVGVMFHIVEDTLWQQALRNLARHLSAQGVLIVSGQFGMITQNVQFHYIDNFSNEQEKRLALQSYLEGVSNVVFVDKRIRSLHFWRTSAQKAGLHIICVIRTKNHRNIPTPENNVLFLTREQRVCVAKTGSGTSETDMIG